MKNLKKLIGGAVVVVIAAMLWKYFRGNLREVDLRALQWNWGNLCVSFIFLAATFGISGVMWMVNLRAIGEKVSVGRALRIMALSTLPKYVPGKVWGVAAQVFVTNQSGIVPSKSTVAIILGGGITILSGVVLASIILPNLSPAYLLIILPASAALLLPSVFLRIANFCLRGLKQPQLCSPISAGQILSLFVLNFVSWGLQGTGIYFLIKSFFPLSATAVVPLCGMFALAWVVGFLSVITPAGVGVREGMLAYLFSFVMPTSIGIIAAVLIRLWMTVGEVLFFGAFAWSVKK